MGRYIDHYADGRQISARRQQKADILADALRALYPRAAGSEMVDFGCADGAVPVLLLQSSSGEAIRQITGITLLDYNDLPEKPAHAHPRFRRVIADLAAPLDDPSLPWGACDVVTATAFFHYFDQPEVPIAHAARLLKPGGYLLAGMPAAWVLRLRSRGVPGLIPRNRRIRSVLSMDAWQRIAESCGFTECARRAVQWLGVTWSDGGERWLRRTGLLRGWGSNYLVAYQKR